jgi:peptidoglycan-associated lipoprotein
MTRSQSIFGTAGALAAAALFLFGAAGCGGPEYPNCNNDEDCHEGEYCVNGLCQQCRPDMNDCGPGQQCVDGRCEDIPGYCASNADCPDGEECQNNRCVAVQTAEAPPPEPTPTACSLSTVYFAYDSSELDGSARNTLESNASCINERDIASVTLVGHCDPRGTEEYNLALGERRAQSVEGYLERLGVDGSRLSTRSMGEEMARGTDESSWARDRRVEFQER